mmetsp:Transcript_89626/g.256056  ORF Transcript_89626/g.256056 Transcript_89626/m.256056 type:complete len:237 (-) Transcript_89626:2866-3576(-)
MCLERKGLVPLGVEALLLGGRRRLRVAALEHDQRIRRTARAEHVLVHHGQVTRADQRDLQLVQLALPVAHGGCANAGLVGRLRGLALRLRFRLRLSRGRDCLRSPVLALALAVVIGGVGLGVFDLGLGLGLDLGLVLGFVAALWVIARSNAVPRVVTAHVALVLRFSSVLSLIYAALEDFRHLFVRLRLGGALDRVLVALGLGSGGVLLHKRRRLQLRCLLGLHRCVLLGAHDGER